MMSKDFRAGTLHRDVVSLAQPSYELPVGGWIEQIELRPIGTAGLPGLPNMDARAKYRLRVELIGASGEIVPLHVTVVWAEAK